MAQSKTDRPEWAGGYSSGTLHSLVCLLARQAAQEASAAADGPGPADASSHGPKPATEDPAS